VKSIGPVVPHQGLESLGLRNLKTAYWNLGAPALVEQALLRQEARLADGGPLVALTGEHTGRSPKDKFIVEEPETREEIWWGDVNVAIEPDSFERLLGKARAYLQGREVFVQDCFAGADPDYRLSVRVVTECAWHNLFARNMFIQPSHDALADFAPDFTVLQVPGLEADPATDGTRSGSFILVSFTRRIVLIGGTSYAGEIKKSVFSILNYLLPAKDVLPMHCSANIGPDGDTAIFFGLSGTGKTTLSADGSRTLIGDDEHGWSDNGVFNFEGGCYAKVIRLSEEAEPEIYATTKRFGTVLENVVMDPDTRALDLDSAHHTENTRASYPIEFIPNVSDSGRGPAPTNIVMLTADAFGVLPPISQLTPEQAMYHFLSGYTARVAGTEKGLGAEPAATFSTCFGAPFMPRHPSVYAEMLRDKMQASGARCWLVNTGWSGGQYGVGKRMDIKLTRAMLRAALAGALDEVEMTPHPDFGVLMPTACPGVPSEVLDPRRTWADPAAYDRTAADLVRRFEENFKQFEAYVDDSVKAAGIYQAQAAE
jgi:phosphoenolpyruvate carboxykinase (ATP)